MRIHSIHWLWAGLASIVLGTAWAILILQPARTQAAILRADPEAILADAALRPIALKRGRTVFAENCAGCHGTDAKGDARLGVSDLTDDEHLYGSGLVAEIEQIARHGIRSSDRRRWNLASMPVYASPRPYREEPLPALTPRQIEDVTQFLLGIRNRSTDNAARVRGGDLYQNYAGCWDCHGHNAAGDAAIGAPSLTDSVWLYGRGNHDDIYRSIAAGRAGISPAFERKLTAAALRDVAVYVASLPPAERNGGRTR